MRFQFIAKHRGIWQVRLMCGALGVSRGGFYEWLRRSPSARARVNEQLLVSIRTSFEQSDRTYGSRRVVRDLHDWGFGCSINRVARLMLVAGLKARHKRRRLPIDHGVRPECSIAPNLLAREFVATAPNQRWVADFTYIWTAEGWLYFAVVLDLYSRRVVGWSMSDEMTAQLVTDALVMALWRRGKPQELLHHSDQGSQGDFQWLSQHLINGGVVWDDRQDGLRSGQDGHRCGRQAGRVSTSGKLSRRSGCALLQERRVKMQHWRAA